MQKCVGFICLWMRPWPNILQKGYFSVHLWICLQAVWEDARILLHILFVPLSSKFFILSAVQIDCTFCNKHTGKIQSYLFNSFSGGKKKENKNLAWNGEKCGFVCYGFLLFLLLLFWFVWGFFATGGFCLFISNLTLPSMLLPWRIFFPQSFVRDHQSRRLYNVTAVARWLH